MIVTIEKTIVDLESLEELLPGELSPKKNPVKWAVYQALQTCRGQPVSVAVRIVVPPPEAVFHCSVCGSLIADESRTCPCGEKPTSFT